ncbi:MAG: hypothetical protein AABX16_02420 [Nanoarchaeota archaeon]
MGTQLEHTLRGIKQNLESMATMIELIEKMQTEQTLQGNFILYDQTEEVGFIAFDDGGINKFSYKNKQGGIYSFRRH